MTLHLRDYIRALSFGCVWVGVCVWENEREWVPCACLHMCAGKCDIFTIPHSYVSYFYSFYFWLSAAGLPFFFSAYAFWVSPFIIVPHWCSLQYEEFCSKVIQIHVMKKWIPASIKWLVAKVNTLFKVFLRRRSQLYKNFWFDICGQVLRSCYHSSTVAWSLLVKYRPLDILTKASDDLHQFCVCKSYSENKKTRQIIETLTSLNLSSN